MIYDTSRATSCFVSTYKARLRSTRNQQAVGPTHVAMRVQVSTFAASLLLFVRPSFCSPWRRAGRPFADREAPSYSADNTVETAPPPSQRHSSSSPSNPVPGDVSEVLLRTKAWLKDAADPSTFDELACSDEAISSWTDRCDDLAGSEDHKMQLATLLTICQHRRSSKANVPVECVEWLDERGPLDTCVE